MNRYFHSGRGYVFAFTLFYVLAFSAGFAIGGDYEFVIYTGVMIAALLVSTWLIRDVDIPTGFLWALSLAGILHMLGGGVHVHGERLYAFQIFDLYDGRDPGLVLFKYDQFVHLVGYGAIAAAIHSILRRACPDVGAIGRAMITVLATMGIGSFNEIAEFTAALSLPSTGVGDYSNTLLDLSFNTLGAVIGVAGYETIARLSRRPVEVGGRDPD